LKRINNKALKFAKVLSIAILIGKSLSIPIGLYISTMLGATAYGTWIFFNTLFVYFGYINLGILAYVKMKIPHLDAKGLLEHKASLYKKTFTTYSLLTAVLFLVIIIYYHLTKDEFISKYLYLILIYLIVRNLNSYFSLIYKSEGMYIEYSYNKLYVDIFKPIASLILCYFLHLRGLIISLILVNVISVIEIYITIDGRKFILFGKLISLKEFKSSINIFSSNKLDSFSKTLPILLFQYFGMYTGLGLFTFANNYASIKQFPFLKEGLFVVGREMNFSQGSNSSVKTLKHYFTLKLVFFNFIVLLSLGSVLIIIHGLSNTYLTVFKSSIDLMFLFLSAVSFECLKIFIDNYFIATNQLTKKTRWSLVSLSIISLSLFYAFYFNFNLFTITFLFVLAYVVGVILQMHIVYNQIANNKFFILEISKYIFISLLIYILMFVLTKIEISDFEFFKIKVIDMILRLFVYNSVVFAVYSMIYKNYKFTEFLKIMMDSLFEKFFKNRNYF